METHNIVALNLNRKSQDDFTTVYDLAEGDKEFIMQIPERCSVFVEARTGVFQHPKGVNIGTALTGGTAGTIEFRQGSDGVNSNAVEGLPTVELKEDSVIDGWKKDIYNARFLHLIVKTEDLIGGTLRLLITIKDIKSFVTSPGIHIR